jgi:hypothetical protein
MIDNPFFTETGGKLRSSLRGYPSATETPQPPTAKSQFMDSEQPVLAVVGECDGKEIFAMWPIAEIRGIMTHDWKTLTIALASVDVIVKGERMDAIVKDLAAQKGVGLRPMISHNPKEVSISAIRIVAHQERER